MNNEERKKYCDDKIKEYEEMKLRYPHCNDLFDPLIKYMKEIKEALK